MSTTTLDIRLLLQLLVEYTKKFKELAEEKMNNQTGAAGYSSKNTNIKITISRIVPPARSLAQFVSQRLNNIDDDLERLETELRLAEYEAALETLQK